MIFEKKEAMKVIPLDGALAESEAIDGCWVLVWNYTG
jgi:hypothetical protein